MRQWLSDNPAVTMAVVIAFALLVLWLGNKVVERFWPD